MSVTDSYTQSQTRLHNSVTALDTATAHWRRNAANAHLAAHFSHLLCQGQEHLIVSWGRALDVNLANLSEGSGDE